MKDSKIVWVYLCSMLVIWIMIDKVLDVYFNKYEVQQFQDGLWFAGCLG